jgi:hypothetical protein
MTNELRFGVGSASGRRSKTWLIKAQKNDVYLMQRRVGGDVKVSFHEGGPFRFALTAEHLKKPDRLQAPEGTDPRLAKAWPRPPEIAPGLTRAFSIFVPWFEVIERPGAERGSVTWADPPPKGSAVEFDVFFSTPTAEVSTHPGARSMGTRSVGTITLPNAERVFVVWWTPEITDAIQQQLDRLFSAEVLENGQPVSGLGMLTLAVENGVGVHIDVTLPDVVAFPRAALVDGEARCPRCGAMLGTPEERAKLVAAISSPRPAGLPVRHMSCGQYFRARLGE